MNTTTDRELVLLVEDDPNDILLMQRAFRKAELTLPLQVVRDGDEAIAYVSGQGKYADRERYPMPALMLLDLNLPGKSGHEVLAWLRAQPLLKRLPVVMLTSSTQVSDVNDAYDRGVNSYLAKPAEFKVLHQLLASLESYWLNLNRRPEIAL